VSDHDVDVVLDLTSAFFGDLSVSLAAPTGQATLFGQLCGALGTTWDIILDDDATNAIACVANQTGRVRTIRTADGAGRRPPAATGR
jgi:hypothetical protein